MKINNGDYKKDYNLINGIEYIDKRGKRESITLKEEKFVEFLIFSLQKRDIINKTTISKDDFKWDKNIHEMIYTSKEGVKYQTFSFKLSRADMKEYLKIDSNNFKYDTENLLNLFSTRKLKYRTKVLGEDEQRTILPIKNFNIMLNEKTYINSVFVSINVEFVYLSLPFNQCIISNMNRIRDFKSRYSLRLYQEMEKSTDLKHFKLVDRSLNNMNRFFSSNLTKQKMEQTILRVKQEFLLQRLYYFNFEMKKNSDAEWIFIFTPFIVIESNKNILDYIKTYEDYRLLTQDLREEFKIDYENDYLKMIDLLTEKNKKSINSRTAHIQKK